MSFIEVSVNDFGFVWFVSFCFACFGWFLLFFFSFGTCLETGFRTGDSLGFYLLINFPTGWRKKK